MSSVQQSETTDTGRWGTRLQPVGPSTTRGKIVFVLVVLVIAFVAAQTCQKSQIRINKNQAITKAEDQVGFTPQRTQVRLLRQGLNSKPYWIVSLSRPGSQRGTFRRLAVVRIDANTGKVKTVNQPRGSVP